MSRCSRMTLWVRQYRSRLRAHSHCGSRTTGSSVVDTKDDVRICRKGRCGARAAGMKPHDSAVLSSAFERREPLCGRFGHGGLLAGPVGARQGPGSTDAGGRGARTSGLRSMSPGSSPGAAPRLRSTPRSRLRRPASSRQRRSRPSARGSAGGLSGLGGAGGALRRDGPVDEEADRGRAGAVADSAAVSVALDGEQAAVVQLAGEALGP